MRKRLRKKLQRGEFSPLSFRALVRFRDAHAIEYRERLERGEPLTEAVPLLGPWYAFATSRGLWADVTIGVEDRARLVVDLGVRRLGRCIDARCTDDDREAVASWLRARPDVAEVEVGPLEDPGVIAKQREPRVPYHGGTVAQVLDGVFDHTGLGWSEATGSMDVRHPVEVGGVVENLRLRRLKNKPGHIAFFDLRDGERAIEVIAFSQVAATFPEAFEGRRATCRGRAGVLVSDDFDTEQRVLHVEELALEHDDAR